MQLLSHQVTPLRRSASKSQLCDADLRQQVVNQEGRFLLSDGKINRRCLEYEAHCCVASRLFKTGSANELTSRDYTARIAGLQAMLRADNLVTHLRQAFLLSDEQRQRYASLRGYTTDSQAPASVGER